MMTALFILIAGIIGSYIVGNRLSAATAAVAGTVAGLVNGAGLITSLLIGGWYFLFINYCIAQVIFKPSFQVVVEVAVALVAGFGGGGYRWRRRWFWWRRWLQAHGNNV